MNINRLISDFAAYIKNNPQDLKTQQIVSYLIYCRKRIDVDITHLNLIFDFRDNTLVRVKPDISIKVTKDDLTPI